MKMKNLFLAGLAGIMVFMTGCGDETETDLSKTTETEQTSEQAVEETSQASVEHTGEMTDLQKAIFNNDSYPQLEEAKETDILATIRTNKGNIKLRLFPDKAPKAVENFVTHAKDGYYDGVIFHRVIKDFMIQSGDPDGTGMGGESIWGEPFENEVSASMRHFRGALSMANTGQDYTNGSQFFIVQNNSLENPSKTELEVMLEEQEDYIEPNNPDNNVKVKDYFSAEVINEYLANGGAPHLDYQHTVFGQVYEGMDVVDAIASVEVDEQNNHKPVEDVVIEGIDIEE